MNEKQTTMGPLEWLGVASLLLSPTLALIVAVASLSASDSHAGPPRSAAEARARAKAAYESAREAAKARHEAQKAAAKSKSKNSKSKKKNGGSNGNNPTPAPVPQPNPQPNSDPVPQPSPTPAPNPNPPNPSTWTPPPFIGGDTRGWVSHYTAPAGYREAVAWMMAVADTRRKLPDGSQEPGTVEIDYLRLYATVNGQNRLIAENRYGTGAGRQSRLQNYESSFGNRQNWPNSGFEERPGNVAAGFTDSSMIVRPSDYPAFAAHWWNVPRGAIPAGHTNVWAECRIRVTGSAVAQLGHDFHGNGITNGSGTGFTIWSSTPNWQIVRVAVR